MTAQPIAMVREAWCLTCGDVEVAADFRCPRCGGICPKLSAGRPKPATSANAPANATPNGTAHAAPEASKRREPVVLPRRASTTRWARETRAAADELAAELARQLARQLAARDALNAEIEQMELALRAVRQLVAQVKVEEAPERAEAAKTRPNGNPRLAPGQWSRKYDRCVVCGRTDRAHRARGRCFTCDSAYHRKGRGAS